MDPLNPLPSFQVDPELQRLFQAATIDYINALCKAIPRMAQSLTSGVTVSVSTDNHKIGVQVYIPGEQTSRIIPVTQLPQGIKPIKG